MSKRSISGRNLDLAITSDDILGKDVIDKEGNFIGIVEKVLIDPHSLNVIGIEVDKGFLKNGLSIGKSYIDKVTEHAIFLSVRVAYEVKGMLVFDRDGKKIGTVLGVELYGHQNKVKSIRVKKSGLLRGDLNINSDYIETMGDNIILNITKKRLDKL